MLTIWSTSIPSNRDYSRIMSFKLCLKVSIYCVPNENVPSGRSCSCIFAYDMNKKYIELLLRYRCLLHYQKNQQNQILTIWWYCTSGITQINFEFRMEEWLQLLTCFPHVNYLYNWITTRSQNLCIVLWVELHWCDSMRMQFCYVSSPFRCSYIPKSDTYKNLGLGCVNTWTSTQIGTVHGLTSIKMSRYSCDWVKRCIDTIRRRTMSQSDCLAVGASSNIPNFEHNVKKVMLIWHCVGHFRKKNFYLPSLTFHWSVRRCSQDRPISVKKTRASNLLRMSNQLMNLFVPCVNWKV